MIGEELQKQKKNKKKQQHGTGVCKTIISNEMHRESFKPRIPRKTPLPKKVQLKSRLEYAKKYISEDTTFFDNVIWSNGTKIRLFDNNVASHVWRRDGSVCDMKNTILAVKHGGGNVMI